MTLLSLVGVVCFTALVAWALLTAQRLNRLHIRTDAARQQLEAALHLRATLAGMVLPEARDVARRAQSIDLTPEHLSVRAAAERDLSEILDAHQDAMSADLVEARTSVQLTYRFYNNAVTDTRALQSRPLVRLFRLGGTSAQPEYFELGWRHGAAGAPEAKPAVDGPEAG